MKNWDEKNFEKISKKNRVRKNKSQKFSDLRAEVDDFILDDEGEWSSKIKDCGFFPARVVEVHKRYVFISTEDDPGSVDTTDVWIGSIARRHLLINRKERNFLVVGDRVLCRASTEDEVAFNVSAVVKEQEALPHALVEHRAPRTSKIARIDPINAEREHVLAANMDQLVIVASFVSPLVKWGLIDRYLVLAETQGIKPIIILNKKDLLKHEKSEFQKQCAEKIEMYTQLGYTVLTLQANAKKANAQEVQAIKKIFDQKISLLSGHSGVGKSTIVNLFKPEIEQDVEDETILTKGRHTTSYASFIKLGTGGYVIDSPGIRSFVLQSMNAFDLSHGFVEMRPFLRRCKYRECQHNEEPDCAIRKTVDEGKISSYRYRSYLGILLGTTGREGRLRDQGRSFEEEDLISDDDFTDS